MPSPRTRPCLRLVRLVALLFLPLAAVATAVLLMLPGRMNAVALESARQRAQGLTEVTARLVAPTLDFDAREEASRALAQLDVEPEILGAVLYDEVGRPFAHTSYPSTIPPEPPHSDGTRIVETPVRLEVIAQVSTTGGTHGTLLVWMDLGAVARRRAANTTAAGAAAAVVALVGLIFSVLTAVFLVRRERAEEASRRAAASFAALADSLPVAVVIHRDDRILYVNPAGQQLLASGRDIPEGASLAATFRLDDSLPAPSRSHEMEERAITLADGRALAVAMGAVPVEFHDAEAVALVAMDLTERKRLLERLVITDRLASLGTMAAGVAHEINNPLAIVLANVEMVRRQVHGWTDRLRSHGELAEVLQELDDVRDAARRVGRIVKDLRSLSRSEDTVGAVDLEQAIDKALQMVASQVKLRARVERRLGGVPQVSGNEGRLVQVFINLLINAAQAMPERATADNLIEVATSVNGRGEVVATVSDSGCGIPADIRDQIFDPFFTTKPVGVGTGLGLSIVHNLVRTMNGRIELASAPGQGTTFTIVLPACAAEGDRRAAGAAEEQPSRRARLLIVDDEPMVSRAMQRLLGRTHEVVTSQSASAALEQLGRGERFDLILCDLRMPGMSGIEMARRLSAENPQQRARLYFMTGDQGAAVEEDLGPVLEKPFTCDELSRFLDAQLRGAA